MTTTMSACDGLGSCTLRKAPGAAAAHRQGRPGRVCVGRRLGRLSLAVAYVREAGRLLFTELPVFRQGCALEFPSFLSLLLFRNDAHTYLEQSPLLAPKKHVGFCPWALQGGRCHLT